jgi:uncharacterized protein (TIGR00297 family)
MAIELNFVAVVIVCLLISVIAYWKHVLSLSGVISAFFVGIAIGVFGGIAWLLLLLIFLIASFGATKYKFEAKKRWGVQEGKKGERTWRNVVANGAVPVVLAILNYLGFAGISHEHYSLLYLTALATAAADTLASEIGVLSERVYLITTLKRVQRGTNGGVSFLGLTWAFIGSAFVALSGIAFLHYTDKVSLSIFSIALITLAGFIGCQIDSLLGATLENHGLLTKGTNNLCSIALSVMLAEVILWVT